MEHLDVVADDVVADQEVSLSQVIYACRDRLVCALVVVDVDLIGVQVTGHEAVDRVEPLPHEAVGL